jgi:transposase
MRASPDSLLRLIREAPPGPDPAPRVIGVDEWAKRRGRSYGGIIVDLERHEVVDLLDDATAEDFSRWLKAHPGVEVISRDRGGAFAEGGRDGAPDAIQIADRFHLLKNLGDAVEDYLARIHRQLPPQPDSLKTPAPLPGPRAPDATLSHAERERQRRRSRRLERYNAVLALHAKGVSARQIARSLDLDRQTVRKYIHAGAFPEIGPRAKRPSLLDPHRAYLRRRWDEGCHNAMQHFRELKGRGFAGQRAIVADAVARLRQGRSVGDATEIRQVVEEAPKRRVSPRQVRWWFQGKPDEQDAETRDVLTRFLADHDEARGIYDLTQRFGQMIRERRQDDLASWLRDARRGPRELQSFARGIDRDRAAVDAALTYEWSQGQVEGQVNRLKLTKRSMFGRGKVDLLRRRMLEAA